MSCETQEEDIVDRECLVRRKKKTLATVDSPLRTNVLWLSECRLIPFARQVQGSEPAVASREYETGDRAGVKVALVSENALTINHILRLPCESDRL